MAYKKKFLNKSGVSSPISGINSNSGAWNGSPGQNGMPTGGWNNTEFGYKNYMSRLPEVYTGHPNRIERYNQYEMMDVDAEINACLDIIAEFSTQRNEHNKTPFSFEYKEDPTPREVELLTKQLQQWCKLNEFDVRMFKIFRNVVKYGDQVFVRDPENFKLYWVDMVKVIKVIVNESEGKKPEQYVIKDININLQNLSVAQKTNTDFAANPATGLGGTGGGTNTPYTVPAMPYNTTGSRFTLGQSESAVDAKHVVHLSLTEGLDRFWPFGQSVLENIFKVYKQKELLEDAVLIYRVQRAPERRMFKIDVGNMPSHLAMAFVERVKNEIHQRRIPSLYGGQSIVDASYNPLSMNEDYFFPVTAEGRGSSVEVLPGGQNLGEIDDLKYFNNRLARGLRVPSSYLPTGPDDNTTPLSDGRVGTAMIQEFRFNQYCERLQNYICLKLDEEFKLFLRWRGFNIDTGLFQITFNPPQNFAAYRQSELDTARVSTFASIEAFPYISKRFALERFLGLSEEEIKKNEQLWLEENAEDVTEEPKGSDLRNVGVSTGDFEADEGTAEDIENADMEQEPGAPETAGPVSGPEGAAAAGAGGGPLGGGGAAGAMQI
jgi:Bacteriophage T4-like portal protein (Gp20)